ncbi:hypothetical protein SCALM49S_06448 [Streptomyces californicus]
MPDARAISLEGTPGQPAHGPNDDRGMPGQRLRPHLSAGQGTSRHLSIDDRATLRPDPEPRGRGDRRTATAAAHGCDRTDLGRIAHPRTHARPRPTLLGDATQPDGHAPRTGRGTGSPSSRLSPDCRGRTSTAFSPWRPIGTSARRRWKRCTRRSRTTGAGTTSTVARPYDRRSSASSATSSISSRSSGRLLCGTACTASRPNLPDSPDGPTSTPASTTRHVPTSPNPSAWPRPSMTASSWPTSSPA